jgi:hypothetical protein
MPRLARDLGKKFGAEVGKTQIGLTTTHPKDGTASRYDNEVFYLDIPPSLRYQALSKGLPLYGQPLSSPKLKLQPPPGTPEFNEWMKDSERGALVVGPTRQKLAAVSKKQKGKSSYTKFSDAAYELRRQFLLSSPTTFIKQWTDAMSQIEHPALKLGEATLENTRVGQQFELRAKQFGKLVGWIKTSPTVRTSIERHFEEVPEHLRALYQWIGDNGQTMPQDPIGAGMAAIREANYHLQPHHEPVAIPGKAGKVIRTPQRIVGFADQWLKEVTSGTSQASWAVREAKKRHLSGAMFEAEVARLRKIDFPNLPDEAQREIFRIAQEKTLTESLGAIAKSLNSVRQSLGLRWAFPFFQVGSNIVRQTYQRTPFYLPEITYKTATEKFKGGRVSEELAKPLLGTLFTVAMFSLAKAGIIIGQGPEKNAKNYNKQGTGWLPNSVHMKGQYVSFDQLGHLGNLAAMAADIHDAKNEKDQKAAFIKLKNTITRNLTPKTMDEMGSLFILMKEIEDEGAIRGMKKFAGRTASGMIIPRVISRAAQAGDSNPEGKGNVRKMEEIPDFLKADIPGLRETLPILRSSAGRPVTRDTTAVERMLSPINRSSDKPERTAEREFEHTDFLPRATTKTVSVPTRVGLIKVELLPEERERLLDANAKATQIVEKLAKSPGYQNLPAGQKAIILKRVYENTRRAAIGHMMGTLRKRAMEMIRNQDLPQEEP